jgi:hypothetical protein
MIVATVVGVVLVVAILFVVLNLGSVGAAPREKAGGGTEVRPESLRPRGPSRSDDAGPIRLGCRADASAGRT